MNKPITVVIADDHPLFRKGLKQAIAEDDELTILGEAGDGETALRLIQEFEPHVAVLDIDMPKKTGLEVASILSESNSPTAVAFLTIYTEEGIFNKAMDLGARGYVLKESAVIDIAQCIKLLASGKHYISPGLSDQLLARSDRARALVAQNPSLDTLTPAERRILKLIAENKTSKDIAELLHISFKTVETHRFNIAAKLNIHGSHSLLKFALENKSALK